MLDLIPLLVVVLLDEAQSIQVPCLVRNGVLHPLVQLLAFLFVGRFPLMSHLLLGGSLLHSDGDGTNLRLLLFLTLL